MHYDIRLKCLVTGEFEATEDIGYPTVESAARSLEMMNSGCAYPKYVLVPCDEAGSHPCHDVDLSYYRHWRDHMGDFDRAFERWVGAPTDDMIRHV